MTFHSFYVLTILRIALNERVTYDKKLFAIYNPKAKCVEVRLDAEMHISFNYQKCNTTVHLDKPSNIAYIPRLAREEPKLYAKLFSRDGSLLEYIEAMKSLIKYSIHCIYHCYIQLLLYNCYSFLDSST